MGTTTWALGSFALASLLALRGLKRGSLSKSGAVAAFFVGSVHMGSGLQFGATLIFFYMTSSKLTKIGSARKAQLEAQHTEGGSRSAGQVLANSLVACALAAALYVLRDAARALPLRVLLTGAFLGHYACCCGDTWASEVGILSASPPRLLTSWRRVPAGTNGGVTPLGLACSAACGVAVAAAYALTGAVAGSMGPAARGGSLSLTRASPLDAGSAAPGAWSQTLFSSGPVGLLPLLAVGVACSLGGSLLDSLLGATLQFSGVELSSGKVVQAPGPGVKHVSGVGLLSNSQVNLLSSACSAALGAYLLSRW